MKRFYCEVLSSKYIMFAVKNKITGFSKPKKLCVCVCKEFDSNSTYLFCLALEAHV